MWKPILDVSLSLLRRGYFTFEHFFWSSGIIYLYDYFQYYIHINLNFWWQNFLDFFSYTADINGWGPTFFQDSEGTITSAEINDI